MDQHKENSPLLGSTPSTSTIRSYTFSYGPTNENINHAEIDTKFGVGDDYHITHCHDKERKDQQDDKKARKTLIIASILCLTFMVAEIIGGYIASSLAIMTDAAHLLTDFASFMISLFSLFVAARPATRRMSFGWHRAEVLGALVSVLMIWVITGILVYMAIERIINKKFDVDGEIMLITASVGVGVNIIMGIILHRGGATHGHSHGGASANHSHAPRSTQTTIPNKEQSFINDLSTVVERSNESQSDLQLPPGVSEIIVSHDQGDPENGLTGNSSTSGHKNAPANINIRAAFIHVIGDFLQSLGVFVAALIIYFKPQLGIIDPICTFVFSVLVLITTIAIMRDAVNVLMEGLPRGIDFNEVNESLLALEGVERVHDLRIWSLTMNKIALAVHLAVNSKNDAQVVLKQARELLRHRYNIYECTVQIEVYTDDMNECRRCEVPKK